VNLQSFRIARRLVSVALIVVAVLGLAACGNGNSDPSPSSTAPTGGSGSSSTTTSGSSSSAAASSNVTLSWAAPQSNTDGSYVVDLAGYKILYGTDAANLDQTIVINNPSISLYVVDNLSSGIWHFAIVAVNQSGIESNLSPVVSASIG